jgi:hypothetical protein
MRLGARSVKGCVYCTGLVWGCAVMLYCHIDLGVGMGGVCHNRVSARESPRNQGVEDENEKATSGPTLPGQVLSRSREGNILTKSRRLRAAALHFAEGIFAKAPVFSRLHSLRCTFEKGSYMGGFRSPLGRCAPPEVLKPSLFGSSIGSPGPCRTSAIRRTLESYWHGTRTSCVTHKKPCPKGNISLLVVRVGLRLVIGREAICTN